MTTLPLEAKSLPQKRLSRVLDTGCLLLALSLPLLMLVLALLSPSTLLGALNLASTHIVWSLFYASDPDSLVRASDIATPLVLNGLQMVIFTVLVMIPTLFQSWGLLSVRQCFRAFVHGDYFSLAVVKGLRGFAAGTFLSIIAGMLATPLISLVVTLYAERGQHSVAFSINSGQLLMLLFAGILWQIAGVMTRAATLSEENSQFV